MGGGGEVPVDLPEQALQKLRNIGGCVLAAPESALLPRLRVQLLELPVVGLARRRMRAVFC
jgi:hypothetical protein